MPALLKEPTGTMSTNAKNSRFLFTHWEGAGNTPPMLSLVRGLVARGHAVRVLSDPCNREEAEAAGASFASWTRGYRRMDKSVESDLLKDWEVTSPLAQIARLRDRLFVGPSLGHAQDLVQQLDDFPADTVVTSEMLLGAMAGAESVVLTDVADAFYILQFSSSITSSNDCPFAPNAPLVNSRTRAHLRR